jgi:POT family proton-dependent oligopeptide transporter
MSKYRTGPLATAKMPPGIPYIIGNEAAERFSFYGMKGILAIFMVQYLHLMGSEAGTAMTEAAANEKVHYFNTFVYATPFLGAILADAFFGKYRIIVWLSIVYCMGHATLAFMGEVGDAKWLLFAGLALISLGAGGIKPCVSAHVGDQFGKSNSHHLPRIFNIFYFSINLGAFISMLLTPWLLKWYGPHLAFGIPGVLMALATFIFWLGRKRFVHVPAGGMEFVRETFSPHGLRSLGKLILLFLFIAMFWSLFDQTGSSWIFQALDMDRNLFGQEWLPSQIQSINSLFVLTFIPIFTFILYPRISRVWNLTPLRKISIGLFLMTAAFSLTSLIQTWIENGERPSIIWQVLAYALLTAAEVMVSIVGLEFAYTQAPKRMKSMIMSFFLFSVAFGNFFTARVNHFIQIPSIEVTAEAHPGHDGTLGTADDLQLNEDGDIIESSVQAQLKQAFESIQSAAVEKSDLLPDQETGQAIINSIRDPWGNPLHYALLNSGTARITSDGPDQKRKTEWDLGMMITYTDAEIEEDSETWLAKRKEKLGITKAKKADGNTGLLSPEYFAGGQTKLEGSSYFWFFTWLMLGTAVLFIPYACLYKGKTILQE